VVTKRRTVSRASATSAFRSSGERAPTAFDGSGATAPDRSADFAPGKKATAPYPTVRAGSPTGLSAELA